MHRHSCNERKKMVSGNFYSASYLVNVLKELWNPLTESQCLLLLDNVTVKGYKKGEIIYHEQEIPQHLFFLADGKVKIYKEGVGGRQQIVRMPELKGFFGYRAGLVGTPYITEAAALEDTTLCLIPLPVIKQLICENHTVALFFIEHLATLLGHADEQTVSLTQKHLRGRLAEALLIMKDRYGTDLKSNTLAMEPSREDLANLSNMTTSNAIRTLSSFVSERLVVADGRKITILDEPQLRLIAKNG